MYLKKPLFHLLMGAISLAAPGILSSQEKELCSKEMLMSYFPEPIVMATLDQFKIPQAQHSLIMKDLAEKDGQIAPMVEERAAKMTPNPLRESKMRQEAVKIFRDTLFEVFTSVMNAHGINDKEQIRAMLDDIQKQKARQFANCMEKHKNAEMQNKTNASNPAHPQSM